MQAFFMCEKEDLVVLFMFDNTICLVFNNTLEV